MVESPLDIESALATIGSPTHDAASGSGAALAGALAAAVVAKAARASHRSGTAAQAVSLEDRLIRFAEADAVALGRARSALAQRESAAGPQHDFDLGSALRRALEVPLAIGEACADIAALAAEERENVQADLRADLAAAAAIAAGAAQAAAYLVAVNLGALPDDPEVEAARRFVARADHVAAQFGAI